MTVMSELDKVRKAIATDLGDPDTWGAPVEFRDSLALCALNSAYSLRARSTAGQAVLKRYRAARATADHDGGPDLLQAMDAAGGPEAFARDVLGNRSKLPGTSRVRTVGIYEGLTNLAAPEVGVTTAESLRKKAKEPGVKRAWLSVKGLGPLSWSYLLMNAGVDSETKPDTMIVRYLSRALGVELSADRAGHVLKDAATAIGVEARHLDRAIWLFESPHGK